MWIAISVPRGQKVELEKFWIKKHFEFLNLDFQRFVGFGNSVFVDVYFHNGWVYTYTRVPDIPTLSASTIRRWYEKLIGYLTFNFLVLYFAIIKFG